MVLDDSRHEQIIQCALLYRQQLPRGTGYAVVDVDRASRVAGGVSMLEVHEFSYYC
jgi:hypothetical protein